MAVMLTQWSPVPWSGETVPWPALPPPAETAAPTPIYETLVREWSLAGRTVPGQGRHGRSESAEPVGRWWRTDETRAPHGAPAPAHAPAYAAPAEHAHAAPAAPAPQAAPAAPEAYGGGAYGALAGPYATSPAPYRHVSPYVGVSGYGDGGDDTGGRLTEPRPAPSPGTGEAQQTAPGPAPAPATAPGKRPPAWERVAIL